MSGIVATLMIIVGIISLTDNQTLSYVLIGLGILKFGLSGLWIALFKEWIE
jgi:hypothetical protein